MKNPSEVLRAMMMATCVGMAVTPVDTYAILWDGNQPVDGSFDGVYSDAVNWVGNVTPNAAQVAEFDVPGTIYNVLFTNDPTNDRLEARDNTSQVAFDSMGGTKTYTITQDAVVSAAPLSLDTLHLKVGDFLSVRGGGGIEVVNSSSLDARSLSIGVGSNGQMLVSGVSSSAMTQGGGLWVGALGGNGFLNAELGSQVNIDAEVRIGGNDNPNASTGLLQVQSDADVTTKGALAIGQGDGNALNIGTLEISGAGSSFTQLGAEPVDIGGKTDSFGEVSVTAAGSLTTGTGTTRYHDISELTVSDGIYTVNGEVEFNNSTILVQNDSLVTFNGKFNSSPATVFDFTGGSITFDAAGGDILDPTFIYSGTTGSSSATMKSQNGAALAFAGKLRLSELGGSDSTLEASASSTVGQSTITTADEVELGTNGKGVLRAIDGGLIEIGHDLDAGVFGGGQGIIQVGGASVGFDAQLDVARHLSLGGDANVPGGFGSLTIGPGGIVNVGIAGGGGVTRVYDGDELNVFGGTLNTIDLIFDPVTPVFDFTAGNINVSGGDFKAPTAAVTIEGPSSVDQPTLRLRRGANTIIAADLNIAENAGTFGTVVVEGIDGAASPSTLTTSNMAALDPDIYVGLEGKGELLITNGGHASAADDVIFGQVTGAVGFGQVSGVNGGVRSTLATNGVTVDSDIIVGGSAAGTLRVMDGAIAQAHRDLSIGADGSSNGLVIVGGMQDGFNAEIVVGRDLSVAGSAGVNGDQGQLDVNPGGKVEVPGTLEVFTLGTVNLDGGKIAANKIEHTHGGTFNFISGTLSAVEISGSITNLGGTLAPGHSPGTTLITENYTQATDGVMQIEVRAPSPITDVPSPGDDFDQITIQKTMKLSGTLQVVPLVGLSAVTDMKLGSRIAVIKYGERAAGTMFEDIDGTLLNTSFALAPLFKDAVGMDGQDDTLFLRASIPGDLNLDNKVSVADLADFALNFDTMPGFYDEATMENSWELGDFNADGKITVTDLSLLALNFGFGVDASLPEAALSFEQAAAMVGLDLSTIPEPTSAAMLLTAGALGLGARRRR